MANVSDLLTEYDFSELVFDATQDANITATLNSKVVVVVAIPALSMIESHTFASANGADNFVDYMQQNGAPTMQLYVIGKDILQ